MAITYTNTLINNWVFGSERVMLWSVSCSGTYVTGNTADATPATYGLDVIDFAAFTINGASANTNGVALISWDLTNNKFRMFGTGAGSGDTFTELTTSTTVTGLGFYVLILGVD